MKLELTMLSQAAIEAAAAAPPPDEMCKCKHLDGKPFNVLLILGEGHITAVVCANCELECVESHDLEFLEGEAVPARLTITSETHNGPDGTEYDYFLVLDAQPYEVDG